MLPDVGRPPHDVIGHETVGLGIWGSLWVAYCDHASILHGYGDMEPQIVWGHDSDSLGSRGVIGHVTIGSADPEYRALGLFRPETKPEVGRGC